MDNFDKPFLGRGWRFPPTFRREWYGPEMLAGEEDVRNSIEVILSTIPGERIMLPTFGCNLQPNVFDTMNLPTITMIERVVKEALILHEPRIIVENVVATASQQNGRLDISIDYSIITTNTRYNYVYPYYLTEATNIEI
jgi:phage baseplate assembly protein W